MNIKNPSTKFASAAVFICASVWGLYWVPVRYLEGLGVDGAWAVSLINFPAVVILILFVLWQWRQQRAQIVHAIVIGIFTGLGIALYATGLVYSSVVRVTLLFYLTPIWATLIGMVWLGEQANWQRWVAIFLGLAGLALLVSGGGATPLNIGDLYAFFSGIFWALGAAMIKRYDSVPLSAMMLFQFAFTGVGAIVLGHIAGVIEMPSITLIKQVLPFSALISVLALIPAVAVVFWAQKFLFPGRVGLLMMSEVLVAVISASIFIPEERMAIIEWVGACLIIGACLIEVFLTPHEEPIASLG